MKTGLLFPGQGSQQPQILHDLVPHPVVNETLSEVSAVLRLDVRTLDTPEALQSDVSVQLAILTAGVATARALQESGVAPLAVAGLSVGAFSAAVAADSISLAGAVRLVHSRAEQMAQMYPVGYGLSAIVGLSEAQVAKLVDAVNTKEYPVFVGNINAPRQIVIAGSNERMEQVLQKSAHTELAKQSGWMYRFLPIVLYYRGGLAGSQPGGGGEVGKGKTFGLAISPDASIAELGTLDAGGRPHALNRGDTPEAGQPFRRQGLNDFPAAFELVDIGDEFEDFRGNRDVLNRVHGLYTHFHPFLTV